MQQYLSTEQLDGEIAIVQVDGKDVFLDPGTRFCPYGIVDWRYTSAMGLRQNAVGAEFGETPALDYKQSLTTRKADVSLDAKGALSGDVGLFFKGCRPCFSARLEKKLMPRGAKNSLRVN